ncbi:MAG: sigma-70 family RNA polymerase sigma factor [Chryseolinea sp.]
MAQRPEDLFSKMIVQYQGIIKSICLLYYHDSEDKKDAQQDVLVQLWKAFPSFRNESKISTWIYRVTLNTILARVRQDRKEILLAPRTEMHESHLQMHPFSDDHIQLLRRSIETLGTDEKAIVILYLEGYSNKEIADMINLTQTNINTKMYRIREKLRQMFKTVQHEY